MKGIDSFADGDLAYGYCFHKHHQRNRTLWTVDRVLNQWELPPPPAMGKQPVVLGMGVEACLDLVPMEIGGQIFALNRL